MARPEAETAPRVCSASGGRWRFSSLVLGCFLVQVILGTTPSLAQWKTQDIPLRPGWNAVYLAVQPEPDDPESVFGALPIESVWTWNRRFSSVQFVQDASTLIPGEPDWLTYLPADADLAFLTSLFAIRAGRAYLIKLGGAQDVTWQVTGKAVVRPIDWLPDSFNLVGLPVDASSPPSFANFFAPSPAHTASPTVYRLGDAGVWEQISPDETIAAGEAYWVYCEGSSSYPGPLRLTLEQAGSLDFGRVLVEQVLRVQNETNVPQQLILRPSHSALPPPGLPALAGAVPLSYWDGSSLTWKRFPESLSLSLAPGAQQALRLAVRRQDMASSTAGALYQSLLDLSNGAGTLHSIPVVARGASSTGGSPAIAQASNAAAAAASHPRAGLWVGVASINRVSWAADPTADNRTTPTATASEMQIRLIVHVDGNGQARLLQHVTLMWMQGTQTPDPDSGNLVVGEPGRFVLVTNDDLLQPPSPFLGAAVRDGRQVGRRISSAAFGFREPVVMSGSLGGTLASGPITLAYDDPRNPFLHKFHPDHDNLDYDFQPLPPERSEAYEVVRSLELEFTDTDPDGLSLPGFGDSRLGGNYREALTGLHKETIYVAGTFRLHQVSRVAVLNDGL